jgi:hypothetical protein
VHHQVQKFGNLGLKRFVFGNSFRGHCRSRAGRRGRQVI